MSPRPVLPLRLEYVLLGLIRRDSTYGYELLHLCNDPHGIGLIWRVKPGPLYAALEKLEQHGYLTSALIPGDGSPIRKEYRITPAGKQLFEGWMITPLKAARDFRQDFLAKMYFAADFESEDLKDLIDQQKKQCLRWRTSLEQQLLSGNEFEKLVFTFRIRQIKFVMQWLADLYPDN